ncbi:hypothetical protein SARC_07482, partial [Sphaeroforma arctica JP610]
AERDGYFSSLVAAIEQLYQTNNNKPVVLFGHSMGSACANYFLNFARQQMGQGWLDVHIHTYVAAGGPWLGALKAIRSAVVGEDFGLPFINTSEALLMCRSMGSGAWLLPRGPLLASPIVYVREEGSWVVGPVTASFTTESHVKNTDTVTLTGSYRKHTFKTKSDRSQGSHVWPMRFQVASAHAHQPQPSEIMHFKVLVGRSHIGGWEGGGEGKGCTLNTVYTLAEEDTKLGRRIRHSLEVLQRAIDLYGIHGISLSFNGGKDCTLVLYLWVAACVKAGDLLEDPIHTLYVLEHFCFTEIQEFVDSCAQRFNLDLITKEGTIKEGLGTMLGKYPEIKGVIIGARHTDPFYGNMDELQMTDEDWPQVMRIHPILQWSYQNVWECLLRIGEPVCELYKKGYTSVGNTHNTHPNPALRNESIEGGYDPAWKLTDGTLERAGRDKKKS